MSYRTVAILVPGEMGAAVGKAFHAGGLEVLTCLAGRSDATRDRAAEAGFRDVGSLEALLAAAEVVLSILPPESAPDMAASVAAAMKASGHTPPYADCNAISPDTARAMQAVIEGAGAIYIDGGIIGNPPGGGKLATRFYMSGPQAALMDGLDGLGIDVRQCGPEIGRGAAVKMCYAGITKCSRALETAVLIAAEKLGVADEIHAELEASAAAIYKRMEYMIPRLPAVSGRYIGEMKEIAHTMESAGVTAQFHVGATELYQLLEQSPFASERRDTVDPDRTLRQTVEVCARSVPSKSAAQ
jgi:3-hydroxyisobutyrate dehydrogenase-like beta-hydroxyacid dehydrogenase